MLPAQISTGKSDLELRIVPSELVDGVPEAFTFVLVNIGGHDMRMPQPSQCMGANGTVSLHLDFTPLKPPLTGGGGGCGVGSSDAPGILDQAKSWKTLKPGESLAVSYKRAALFDRQNAPGVYEFWGEYQPPELSAEDITALQHAGIDFPRERLKSAHLRFKRPEHGT
jgi:hypothetical protein